MNNKFILVLDENKKPKFDKLKDYLKVMFKQEINLNIVYINNKNIKENLIDNINFNLENDKESVFNLIFDDFDTIFMVRNFMISINMTNTGKRLHGISISKYHSKLIIFDIYYSITSFPILKTRIMLHTDTNKLISVPNTLSFGG